MFVRWVPMSLQLAWYAAQYLSGGWILRGSCFFILSCYIPCFYGGRSAGFVAIYSQYGANEMVSAKVRFGAEITLPATPSIYAN